MIEEHRQNEGLSLPPQCLAIFNAWQCSLPGFASIACQHRACRSGITVRKPACCFSRPALTHKAGLAPWVNWPSEFLARNSLRLRQLGWAIIGERTRGPATVGSARHALRFRSLAK